MPSLHSAFVSADFIPATTLPTLSGIGVGQSRPGLDILILYDGPLGHKHQDISHGKTLLGLWSEKVAKDLKITRCTKFTFLNDPSESRLDSEVLQYFQDLIPLANEWHILLGWSLLSRTAVWFSDIISLFDCFLAGMPYKKPPEMMNAFQQIITQHKVLNSSMCLSQENDMDAMSSAVMSSKCLCEELTDLPNNSIVNPLAPPPTQQKKGGGCSAGQNAKPKSNVAPPPYMPPIVNGPSPADMPLNPVPQSSMAVATPVFHQHPTDSHCFGFSVLAQQSGHIMPPRMEPGLQVLNNPYIAMIQGDQVPSNTSCPPTPQPNCQSWFILHQPPATVPDSCIDPSLDSSLSLRQTSPTADVCHKSLEKLSSEGSSEEESESLSNNPLDAEVGEVSSDESDKDEDNAFGWGAMNLRQSTHPEWRQREEEEAQRKKAVEEEAERQRQKVAAEEAERQRQRASQVRAQARWDKAIQKLSSMVYDVNTAQRVPGTSVVVSASQGKEEAVAGPLWKRAGMGSSQGEKKRRAQGKGKERATETEEADNEQEAGREDEEEPATPHEGPSGAGVSSWWAEWQWQWQLQAAERYSDAHERAATTFERMARAAEQMVEAMEQTANKWGLYHAWVEWVEMRRRDDMHKVRMAEFKCAGGGWKRLQSEAAEDQNEEADQGVEGDNKEEEEVGGEHEGGEEQEGGREQAMEE
ncbi:hypothetical protein BKA82DRAFT_4355414 [Pisolithus tinctorius]|nr:hypothetical protein BKA82DRAFT_4355414 [Pisolithus tinctorius]